MENRGIVRKGKENGGRKEWRTIGRTEKHFKYLTMFGGERGAVIA